MLQTISQRVGSLLFVINVKLVLENRLPWKVVQISCFLLHKLYINLQAASSLNIPMDFLVLLYNYLEHDELLVKAK